MDIIHRLSTYILLRFFFYRCKWRCTQGLFLFSFHFVLCQNTNSSVNIFLDLMFLLKAWVPYIHPVIVKDVIRITDEVVFFFINEGRNLPLCCSFFHGKPAFQGLRCGLAPRPNQCRCCRRGSGGACVSRDISCRIYGWEEPRAAGHRLVRAREWGRGRLVSGTTPLPCWKVTRSSTLKSLLALAMNSCRDRQERRTRCRLYFHRI